MLARLYATDDGSHVQHVPGKVEQLARRPTDEDTFLIKGLLADGLSPFVKVGRVWALASTRPPW